MSTVLHLENSDFLEYFALREHNQIKYR